MDEWALRQRLTHFCESKAALVYLSESRTARALLLRETSSQKTTATTIIIEKWRVGERDTWQEVSREQAPEELLLRGKGLPWGMKPGA